MNKIAKLIKIATAIQSAKKSIFASKDLLELLKNPEFRKKLEEKQKEEQKSRPRPSKEVHPAKVLPSLSKKEVELQTEEEQANEESKQLERWIAKQSFKRGLLILEEDKHQKDINLLNAIMDQIEKQPLPKSDDPFAAQIRFGISFVKSLRGMGASRFASTLKLIKDFSEEEIKKIEEGLEEREKEELEKRIKFKEEYGVELPEGASWERTLPNGKKIYVISQKQLSLLVSVYMAMKERLKKQREKLEKMKEKAKSLLKTPKEEKKDDLDFSDEELDFLKG